jgi:Dyp-type peroxidase family
MPVPIDFADIQGDILRAYGNRFDRTTYIFVGVGDAQRGQAWLRSVLARVTTAVNWKGNEPDATLNIAFTAAGLTALGAPERLVDSFSKEFRQGMAGRANELGDVGDSAPGGWNDGLGTGAAHALVTINAKTVDALADAVGELESGMQAAGSLSVVHREDAELLAGQREHFGFGDGFSQPAIEGVNEDRARGGGVPLGNGRWRPLALGEFILGYEDEETRVDRQRRLPSAPQGPLGRSGTYMVWRKLQQNVPLFRRTLAESARLYPHGDEALLAAKIVGRWRNGTPLVTSPTGEQADFDPKPPGANDFRYTGDPGGLSCPLGAHIRRSNPRDALGFEGKLSFRHRMIRRGMPYGTLLPPDKEDTEDRGLIFVCFNASISRQFESVQRQWLNEGNTFHLAHDTDYLLGAPDAANGKMTIPGDPPFFFSPQAPFVTTRGGEYLFVPGITGLAAVADGVAG